MQIALDAIKLLVGAPKDTLLVLCVLAALGVLGLFVWKRKKNGNGHSTPEDIMAALSRFESHMAWAKGEIEAMKTKVDPLVIAVATMGVAMQALKEKAEEGFDRLHEKLDILLDRER